MAPKILNKYSVHCKLQWLFICWVRRTCFNTIQQNWQTFRLNVLCWVQNVRLVMFAGHLSTETCIIVARRIHSTLTTSNRALRHIKVPTRADWLRVLISIFRCVLILRGFTFDVRVTSAVWFAVQHMPTYATLGETSYVPVLGERKRPRGKCPGGICPGGMSDSAFYGPTRPTPWVIRSNSTQDSTQKNNFS